MPIVKHPIEIAANGAISGSVKNDVPTIAIHPIADPKSSPPKMPHPAIPALLGERFRLPTR